MLRGVFVKQNSFYAEDTERRAKSCLVYVILKSLLRGKPDVNASQIKAAVFITGSRFGIDFSVSLSSKYLLSSVSEIGTFKSHSFSNSLSFILVKKYFE